jgi:hypothetical protein
MNIKVNYKSKAPVAPKFPAVYKAVYSRPEEKDLRLVAVAFNESIGLIIESNVKEAPVGTVDFGYNFLNTTDWSYVGEADLVVNVK